MGNIFLDIDDKIGYCDFMVGSFVYFVLKIALIVTLWAFVWRYVEPKTQAMRVLRAALLVLGLLVILAMVKITGG